MSDTEAATTLSGRGTRKSECAGACPAAGVFNSPFFWLVIFTFLPAAVSVILSAGALTGWQPMGINDWLAWVSANMGWAGAVVIMAHIFAAFKFPDASTPGTKLHASHYSTYIQLAWAYLVSTVFPFAFILRLRVVTSNVLVSAVANNSHSWASAGGDGLVFGLGLYAFYMVTFMFAGAVLYISGLCIKSILYPVMKAKTAAGGQ